MSSLALSKYVAMYRLHAAKKIMKAISKKETQAQPLEVGMTALTVIRETWFTMF